MAGPVWTFDHGKMERQIRLTLQQHRSNGVIFAAQQTDLARQSAFLQANAAYFTREMAYYAAKVGRLQTLAQSRINEMSDLRDARKDVGNAEVGVSRARIAAEAAVDTRLATLARYQHEDFTTLERTAGAVQTARDTAISQQRLALAAELGVPTAQEAVTTAERARLAGSRTRLTAEGGVVTAQAGVTAAQRRRIAGSRQRLTAEGAVATAQAAQAQAEMAAVGAERPYVQRTATGRRAAVTAGRATLQAERRLLATGSEQRRMERAQQRSQEVAGAQISGAVRGHTGSFQTVRAAVAEQQYTRDLARFELEDQLESRKLMQRDRALDVELTAIDRQEAVETARLGVGGTAERAATVAAKQAAAAQARVAEGRLGLDVQVKEADVSTKQQVAKRAQLVEEGLGLDVRGKQADLADKRSAADRARTKAAQKRLDVEEKEVDNVQAEITARARQGRERVAVEEAGRLARINTRRFQTIAADKQAELVAAQMRSADKQIARERTKLTEDVAVSNLSWARSVRSRDRELRDKQHLDNVEKLQLREKVKIDNLAETIVNWQRGALPSANEYEKRGSPSDLSLIFQGLELLFG